MTQLIGISVGFLGLTWMIMSEWWPIGFAFVLTGYSIVRLERKK